MNRRRASAAFFLAGRWSSRECCPRL